MASLHYYYFCDLVSLLIIISLFFTVNSSSLEPTTSQCFSSLLPLVPCTPFVQGTSVSPGQPCCDNLKQIYTQIPFCLCLLLNDTTSFTSLPINRTLALQLPALCTLQLNLSQICPGVELPPSTPANQVSFGTLGNPPVAAGPPAAIPSSSIIGFGVGTRDAINFKERCAFAVVMTLGIMLLI